MPGVTASPTSIRALLDKPYEMLVALDKRGREVNAEPGVHADADREWVGVAWRMAGEAYLVAREETREVLPYPAQLTRVPGAQSWIKGLNTDDLRAAVESRMESSPAATPAFLTPSLFDRLGEEAP